MKKILIEAAAVGNATARAIAYRTRLKEAYFYPNSAWCTPFVGGSYEFLDNGVRLLDARSFIFFYATGITPAMAWRMVGRRRRRTRPRSWTRRAGRSTAARRYRLHLPPNIPAGDFWSLVLYDTQTRSMLQTDQPLPSIGSQKRGVGGQSGRVGRRLLRPEAADRQGEQLGADLARQGLERACSASTARCSRSSTRPGARARSKK